MSAMSRGPAGTAVLLATLASGALAHRDGRFDYSPPRLRPAPRSSSRWQKPGTANSGSGTRDAGLFRVQGTAPVTRITDGLPDLRIAPARSRWRRALWVGTQRRRPLEWIGDDAVGHSGCASRFPGARHGSRPGVERVDCGGTQRTRADHAARRRGKGRS